MPLWRSRTDRTAHPPGLESLVAEGGDLPDGHPHTRRACGCAAEDRRFDIESCSPSVIPGERKEEEEQEDNNDKT